MRLDPTYEKEDRERLGQQCQAVKELMLDGVWRTLWEIEFALHGRYPQSSLSSRLRQLRSIGYIVERRQKAGAGRGLFEYRVTVNTRQAKQGRLF
jgi:predicted transcriptional regulator